MLDPTWTQLLIPSMRALRFKDVTGKIFELRTFTFLSERIKYFTLW